MGRNSSPGKILVKMVFEIELGEEVKHVAGNWVKGEMESK